MFRTSPHYYVLASRAPSARDSALDRDLQRAGDRIFHARGVAAVDSVDHAVDPVFGPPAHPFDLLELDRPAGGVHAPPPGQHGAVAADSWRVVNTLAPAQVFGRNGEAVVAVLDEFISPLRYNRMRAHLLAQELLDAVTTAAPGNASVGDLAWCWRTELLDRAREAGLQRFAEASLGAVRSTCWDRVVANVPRGGRGTADWDAVSDLLGCATVWATVHGDQPNPFAPAIALTRMSALPAAELATLTCWRHSQPVVRLTSPHSGDAAEGAGTGTISATRIRPGEHPAVSY